VEHFRGQPQLGPAQEHWETFKGVAAGELPREKLPSWQKIRHPNPQIIDDDVHKNARMRAIPLGDRLTEHGISFERLANGDGLFSVNMMVDGDTSKPRPRI